MVRAKHKETLLRSLKVYRKFQSIKKFQVEKVSIKQGRNLKGSKIANTFLNSLSNFYIYHQAQNFSNFITLIQNTKDRLETSSQLWEVSEDTKIDFKRISYLKSNFTCFPWSFRNQQSQSVCFLCESISFFSFVFRTFLPFFLRLLP